MSESVKRFQEQHGLEKHQIENIIFAKGNRRGGTRTHDDSASRFWSTLARNLPGRTLFAIFHHVRRTFHPYRSPTEWTEDMYAKLLAAYAEYGANWEKISEAVGRPPHDCKDHLRQRNERDERKLHSSKWTQQEIDALVAAHARNHAATNINGTLSWSAIARDMGGSKTRSQCQSKWCVCLPHCLQVSVLSDDTRALQVANAKEGRALAPVWQPEQRRDHVGQQRRHQPFALDRL